jgi:2-keto-4-pentenoate hydratase/2-oxohepta-3-ene-1,7-dioic acid hydratase in catechol pathway
MSIKLATIGPLDAQRAVLIKADRAYDVGLLLGRGHSIGLLDVLQSWVELERIFEHLDLAERSEVVSFNVSQLLAPIPVPGTIYCAGANYRDHAAEMARKRGAQPPEDPHAIGAKPWHFIKASQTVTSPHAVVQLPRASKKVDWEAELAVVIGRRCRDVSEDEALGYIAGYTIANDLSARDLNQRSEAERESPFRYDWVSHKSFDGSCPMGPWIVPSRYIEDPHNLAVRLAINGVIKQDSNSSEMTFSINEQIAWLSRSMTLWPGDIILTGTPAGVGAARDEFLQSGDVVTVTIENIGSLTNTIA